MKRIVLFLVICAGILNGISAPAAPFKRPDRFPDVPLEPQSVPTYLALVADPWTNHVAYILFDGNLKSGYRRCYVWIPSDYKYNNPVAINKRADAPGQAAGGKLTSATFPPLKLSATQGDEESAMTWTLSWVNGGGTRGSYDYVSGKAGTYKVPDYSRFDFSLAYESGPRAYSAQASAVAPLDITVVGATPATEAWTNVVPYLPWIPMSMPWMNANMWYPWNSLHFFMGMKQVHEKTKGRVHFDCRLTLDSPDHWMAPLAVRSVPKDWTVLLVVTPYMCPPIYSNTVSAAQAFKDGVEVEMPYGWYDLYWAISCRGFGAVSRTDYYTVMSPQPFAKPDPGQ